LLTLIMAAGTVTVQAALVSPLLLLRRQWALAQLPLVEQQ
jgi:hypothetical protein